ncbi:sialidase family protein [Burkholderia lata]|uniref:Glycosyl hydrolase n=1 Tax=Burkholderia lata (strain ATCC 17760 / DSM 23089 / LMG 22485 / NCIMB 9086 / R18194 / 383) TaxID=482957 RepID=Q39M84_BURL3|nr:sialidase family protein [Burkholderia lata]ABB06432.1 Glycosyl hydrolase [Burkholderia lata]
MTSFPYPPSLVAVKRSILAVLCACCTVTASNAEPVPAPPGQVVAHSRAATRVYLGSPSLAVLPNGDYVATFDTFGAAASQNHVSVFTSHDKGATWSRLGDVPDQYWSSLFVLNGALYLMGTNRSMGTPSIRRSDDGGATWTTPVDAATGMLPYPGRYITGPVPVLVDRGRVWRAYESVEDGDLRALVMSAPADRDLLDARNWRASVHLASDKRWLDGTFESWEEGNVVGRPGAAPAVMLRVNTANGPEKAALVATGGDGRTLSFDPAHDFVDLPGAGKKFTIRFDPRSKQYWTITNAVPKSVGSTNLERVRNTLVLLSSADLRQWTARRILLQHADAKRHGFQYVDWQFDGDDLIAVLRVAFDDPEGGAASQHDSNFITFLRVPRFRQDAASRALTQSLQ